jgi:hypothetical protein
MGAIILSSFYQTYLQKKTKITVDFNLSTLMLLVLTIVGFVPYIGDILVYILYFISFGAMTRYLYEQIRWRKMKL